MNFEVTISSEAHASYATAICQLITDSARARKIGRGKRDVNVIESKIKKGDAIIAFYQNQLAGFSYLDCWDNGTFVVNTGLVVAPYYRKQGLAKQIKKLAVQLAADKYPQAKLFSLTTSPVVMKTNSELGYRPVAFSDLPKDPDFWNGCKTCPNYKALKGKCFKMCFCTAMLLEKTSSSLNSNSF